MYHEFLNLKLNSMTNEEPNTNILEKPLLNRVNGGSVSADQELIRDNVCRGLRRAKIRKGRALLREKELNSKLEKDYDNSRREKQLKLF